MDEGTAARPEIITALAEVADDALVGETYLARTFGRTERTVRRMVGRGELPPPLALSKDRRWLAGRIKAHLRAVSEKQEREAAKRLEKIRGMV